MVESLEDEIAEYEMETGRQPTATTLQVLCIHSLHVKYVYND